MTSDSFKIEAWRKNVEQAGCTISEVNSLQQLTKRDGSPLFSLLDVTVASPDGRPLPNFVFIRGNATVVVPLLINTANGEERFLMVRQHRIGNGMLTLEFPAGMLDHEIDDPTSVARKELLEETGLSIPRDKLVPLWSAPLYSSAGASDEAIYYFGCRIEMKNDRFVSFQNRVRENAGEREFITVTLLTYEEALPQINSIQALLGFSLFHNKFVTK